MGKKKQINQTLALKLGFATLIAIFVVFGVFVLYEMQRVADLNRAIYDHPLVVSNAALQANTSIAKMHRNMKDVVLFKSLSRIHESIKAVDEEEKEVYRHLNTVRDNILGEQGRTLEEEARHLFDEWRIIRGEVIDSVNNNQRDIAADITIGKGAYHVAVLEKEMMGLTNYARGKASIFIEDSQRVQSRLKITSILFLVVGTFLSLLVAFLTLKRHYSVSKNLLESEARYRSLIDNQTDLVCRINPDGQFLFVNDIYGTFFSMPKKELIGSKWQSLTFDDDLELINEKLSTLSKKNPTVIIENRVRSGKGKIHWMNFSNTGLFDSQGNLLEIQSVGRDITALKKSEEDLLMSEASYARAMRGTSDGFWDWNIVTNECYLSQRWKELLGFSEDELANESESFFSRVHPDEVSCVQEAMKAHFEQSVPYIVKHRLRTKKGDYKWFQGRGMAERNEQGQAVIMSGSITDITDFMKAEEENDQLETQLRQAQKMESIGNLAGGIAHEFNNMLTIIMGHNELIMEDLPEASLARESADEIRVAGLRARDVVKQLLTFSRRDDAVKKVLDLSFVVKESIKLMRSSTPANIRIEQNLSAGTYPVMGNDTQINQLIINICNNAVDALPEKEGLITIELLNETIDFQQDKYQAKLKSGQYVKLVICDNGIGMDAETVDRVFEPYFTTKDIGEGTGIGMAVVYGIVERHGGAILADSKLGRGTTYTIFLPTYEGMLELDSAERNIMPRGDEHILYVDDEPSIATLGKRLLEGLGYTAESTSYPEKALDMVRNDPYKFDLLITDMAMPNMTGDQLIIETLKIRQNIPTIICTGYSSRISEKAATNIGACSYIMKPINKSELATVVRKVLDRAKKI
ncbi:MAG: PAS domain S-box protein [Desulfotalea sp.]